MRKILGFLSVLLIVVFLFGTVAFAATPRPFKQKGYDIDVEYYFVQEDMFMYIHDKDNNLLALGLDNEGCLVYGEWNLETGGVKQVLDENGEEYVLGVHAAPASSSAFPIPEIAYTAAEERRRAYDEANEPVELEPAPDAITYEEYIALEAQAKAEGVDFTPAYIQEKQAQLTAQGVFHAMEVGENRDKWNLSLMGYPLHPLLPTKVDAMANPWPGGTATTPRGGKTQKTWMVYIMFEGASKLREDAIQFAPSYWNDAMFSDQEWRPYIDERYFRGEIAMPDKFSLTYALITGNKLHTPNPVTPVASMDAPVFALFNPISQDRAALRTAFMTHTAGMTHQNQNLFAFEHGIYHGSTSHGLWTATGGRYALEPAIDSTGRGGILAVTLSADLNEPYDNANVQGSFGVSGIPTSLTPLRTAAAREAVKQIDMRQFGTFSPSANQWTISQGQVAGGLMMTGYSWEFSAEKCVLGWLPGLWGQSAGGVTIPAADCPPEYNGASVNISLFVCTTHCLDEGRAGQGLDPVLDYWPTRPRQFVVYAHELSHSTLSIADTYDTGAQGRDLSGASYRYPRYIQENFMTTGDTTRIDVVNIPFSGDAAIDPKNWMPGTRYTAAFGNWGVQGISGYVGSTNEDLAARGSGHDGYNLVDLARVIAPKALTEDGHYILRHGDIMKITAGSASPAPGSYMSSGSQHQLFYLSVREDRAYDQVAFDWARDKMLAIQSPTNTTFEGNKSGDLRFSVRNRLANGQPIPAYLAPLRAGGGRQNETAFADSRGGLLITHVDTYRAQSSGTGANATASYGNHVVNVEAHAYPSGIFTQGTASAPYADIHDWGNGSYNASANVTLLDGTFVNMMGRSASKDSHPTTQHMIERFSTDRARGQFIGYDVRVNAGDPADLFNQWGVDEFVNPRLFAGESRVSFENPTSPLTPTAVWAKSLDVKQAHERQRHATGDVVPFAITNVRYYHIDDLANPTIGDPAGTVSCVEFDFAITALNPEIVVDPANLNVGVGVTDNTVKAWVSPDTYPGNREIVWSTNRPDLATVSSTGAITGVASGFATITAALSSDPTIYATCSVYVPVLPTVLSIDPIISSIDVGTSRDLTVLMAPAAADNKNVTWTSSNPAVITVTPTGLHTVTIDAVAGGTAVITVSADAAPNIARSITVTVIVPVSGVTVAPTSATILVGNTQALTPTVAPANATSQDVTWSSNATSIATVSSAGVVTGVSPGAAVITVTTADGGFTATSNITVNPNVINVTGVSLNNTTLTMVMGTTSTLVETVTPPNATNLAVTWSSNSAAATVSGGVVSAVSIGTATITVTTVDGGFNATCLVSVVPIPTTPTYATNVGNVSSASGIAASDLELRNGRVYLKKSLADAIARGLLGVNRVNTEIHPVFTAAVAPNGGVAQISLTVTGEELLALTPDEINLIGMVSGSAGELLGYVNSSSQFDANKFTLLQGGVIYTGLIDPNGVYELLVFIEDGGKFDLDGVANGEVLASLFFASERIGGGGGGCNVFAYLAFALLAVPFVLRRKY